MRIVQSGPHFNLQVSGTPAAHHDCESCHGPGSIHISRAHGGRGFPPLTAFGQGQGKAARDEQLAACLQCHEAAGGARKSIGFRGSLHDLGSINCSTCHTVHAENDPIREREGQAATCFRCHPGMQYGHPGADRMNVHALKCSNCHDLHRPRPG
jgi:predicted CXXCH cytochrome family protein